MHVYFIHMVLFMYCKCVVFYFYSVNVYLFIPMIPFFIIKNCYKLSKMGMNKNKNKSF